MLQSDSTMLVVGEGILTHPNAPHVLPHYFRIGIDLFWLEMTN